MSPLPSEKPCAVPNNSRLGGGGFGRLSEEGSGGILHPLTAGVRRAKSDRVSGCRSCSMAREQSPGLRDVVGDFVAEGVPPGEKPFLAQAMMELDPQRGAVQILIGVQQMDFENEAVPAAARVRVGPESRIEA